MNSALAWRHTGFGCVRAASCIAHSATPIQRSVDADNDLPDAVHLVSELKQMIDEARATVAVAVNTGLTLLYWRIGKRINTEILKGNRAAYGKKILATVSQQLRES